MAKIIGFATIPGAAAQLTFVGGGAVCRFGNDAIDARLFTVARRGQVAAGFAIEAGATNAFLVERLARGGQLAATAFAHEDANTGLTTLDEVLLHRAVHVDPTAWVESIDHPDYLNPTARAWWGPVLLASAGAVAGNAPLPPGARPAGDGIVELELTGEITAETAAALVAEIEAARGRTIALEIDSVGGNVVAAMKIAAALTRHDRRVEAHVGGYANSAATAILCAADVRSMERTAIISVHEPSISLAKATAGTLRIAIGRLDACARNMVAIIAKSTGRSVATVATWLETAISFNAGDAVANGWVHKIKTDRTPAAPMARRVRVAPIHGAYTSFRPSGSRQPDLYEYGRHYAAGSRVRFGGRVFQARVGTIGAPGLEPDRCDDWK
jgi:ATP-dependent protease ClpP protease subunit